MVDISRIPLAAGNITDLTPQIARLGAAIERTNARNKEQERFDAEAPQRAKAAELRDLQIQQARDQIAKSGKQQSFEDLASDTLSIRNLLTNNDIEGARNFALDRLNKLNERRKDDPSVNTRNTESFLQALEADPAQALQLVEGEIKNLAQLGFIEPLTGTRAGSVNQANAPVMLENPTTGETIMAFPTINKNTLEATLEPAQIPEGFQLVTETPEEKRTKDLQASLQETIGKLEAKAVSEPKRAQAVELAKKAAAKADASFAQIDKIRSNISNLREARQLVLDGAGTGPIESLLPSFKAASIALDSMKGRLGLDVVGAVTFGALSKGELDLAKAVAIPTNLDGPDLVDWVDRKIAAQDELATYMEKQAVFLSETDENGNPNTIADWKKKEKSELDSILEAQQITEEDIKTTMEQNDMDRSQVLREIRKRF